MLLATYPGLHVHEFGAAPAIVREILNSDTDTDQYRRINALELQLDELRADVDKIKATKATKAAASAAAPAEVA